MMSRDNNAMQTKPDLRVVLEWKIAASGSVIADVIRLKQTLCGFKQSENMLIAQGLGAPSIFFVASIYLAATGVIAIVIFLVIYWLGKPENSSKRILFSVLFGAWLFYQTSLQTYVSSDALVSAATDGTPSLTLIERLGPPHEISEISNSETMWYYNTGFFVTDLYGITINRDDGKVVDWYIQEVLTTVG